MKERLIWADALKGLLMILVIIGHAIQTVEQETCETNHLWNIIYSFHMPAFMAVSGWLAYRGQSPLMGGGKSLILRRFRQLMIPYFVWSFIMFLLIENKLFSKIFLYPDNFFWFLWALFFINVIFIANQMIAKKVEVNDMPIHMVVCCVLSGIMVLLNLRMFGFQYIAYYFMFYILGYTIHRYDMIRYINGMAAIVMFLAWGVMAWFWNMHDLPSWLLGIPYIPQSIILFAYRAVTATIAIVLLLKVSPYVFDNKRSYIVSSCASFGLLSLGIYAVHLLLADMTNEYIEIKLFDKNSKEVLLAISLIALSYFVVKLISMHKILSKLMLGKY